MKLVVSILIVIGVLLLFKSEGYVTTNYTYKCTLKDENPERKKYEANLEQVYKQCIKDEIAKISTLIPTLDVYTNALNHANLQVKAENICKKQRWNGTLLQVTPPPWYINERTGMCEGYGDVKCIQFFGVCFFKIVQNEE